MLQANVQWLANLINNEEDADPPLEWSGYMAHVAGEKCFIAKATRYIIYDPLIDALPSHPDTVLSSMVNIEDFIKCYGQNYVHLVADLQLYNMAIQIKLYDPTRWNHLLIRPHTLMSFLGCIRNLMKSSGLEEILNVAYNGVSSGMVKRLERGMHGHINTHVKLYAGS